MAKLDPTKPLAYENVTVQEYGQTVLTPKMIRESVEDLRSTLDYLTKEEYYLENRDDTEDVALEEILWNS